MSIVLYRRLFFFNDTATTEIYTLSLHDALPIYRAGPTDPQAGVQPRDRDAGPAGTGGAAGVRDHRGVAAAVDQAVAGLPRRDRKSTRLNSSHANISYAVFCLKKTLHTAKRYTFD